MGKIFKRFLVRRARKKTRCFAYFKAANRLNAHLRRLGQARRTAYPRRLRAAKLSVLQIAQRTREQNRQFARQLPRVARLYALRSNFMRFRHLRTEQRANQYKRVSAARLRQLTRLQHKREEKITN